MRLSDFKVLTFDCYGTLIDWEAGILAALARLRARADIAPQAALVAFGEEESAQQAETPDMLYGEVLAQVYRRLAKRWRVGIGEDEAAAFGASVGDWPAFPDTPAALTYLKQHYALAILSNVNKASFALSNQRLGVEFDAVYTAEEIGSYKPDPRNFEFLLARLAERGFRKGDVLHTAQSLFHDHAPANAIGLASAWIERPGTGAAASPAKATYNFRFPTLGAMAEAHQAGQ